MRNTTVQTKIVDGMRRARKITSEIAAVNSRLEANASPQLAEKAKKALAALNAAVPTDAELFHMDHGMYGMVNDSPIHGVTAEAHLIRQMGGADVVSEKAAEAAQAVRELELGLQSETSVSSIARSNMWSRIASKWDAALSVLGTIAKTVAVAGTGIASYLLASNALENAGIAIAAAVGGALAAGIISLGRKFTQVPAARQPLEEANELGRVLPELKRSLEAMG